MHGLLKRFARCHRGNFAIITAVSIIPVMGMAGLGVDYSQAYATQATLQGEADAIALAVASEGPGAKSRFYDAMTATAGSRVTLAKAKFVGTWTSATEYEVTATADVPRTLSRLIPVGGSSIAVAAKSLARYTGAKLVYKQPETLFLDPLAWDYNKVNAYCYNAAIGAKDKSAARTQSVTIADNDSGQYSSTVPQCKDGETLSFELYNIVWGKHVPKNKSDPSKVNRYFTDTTKDKNGGDVYNLSADLLETILCPNLNACREKPLGIIPVGTGRTPLKNTLPCEKGKYTYYGWEDTPNGDRDYNDIRIIIGCPVWEKAGDENVRLVK